LGINALYDFSSSMRGRINNDSAEKKVEKHLKLEKIFFCLRFLRKTKKVDEF